MPIPKHHADRVGKFVEIVLTKLVNGELDRNFYCKGNLDTNYIISLHNNQLLPQYNDDRIEFRGQVNDKQTDLFTISGQDLAEKKLDVKLVKEITYAIMHLRIKEIK